MIRFYSNWTFLNKTEDGGYLYKSPYDGKNYASMKDEKFLMFEKVYKEYTGEDYPSAEIIQSTYKEGIGYGYTIKIPYTYEELSNSFKKQLELLSRYKRDKRISENFSLNLSLCLDLFGKIYLNEKE
jgi:hypothetical protein